MIWFVKKVWIRNLENLMEFESENKKLRQYIAIWTYGKGRMCVSVSLYERDVVAICSVTVWNWDCVSNFVSAWPCVFDCVNVLLYDCATLFDCEFFRVTVYVFDVVFDWESVPVWLCYYLTQFLWFSLKFCVSGWLFKCSNVRPYDFVCHRLSFWKCEFVTYCELVHVWLCFSLIEWLFETLSDPVSLIQSGSVCVWLF